MRAVGIIAEYNPFHNGHRYHIARARELTHADAVIAVMSGAFTQRGDAAILDKWTRARMALQNGADMVIELPCLFALREAQGFACGGVKLLSGLGIVDTLAFGCEEECIPFLESAAACLLTEPDNFRACLHSGLKSGMSYPLARSRALSKALGIDESILNRPNFSLALEYAQSNMRLGSPLKLMPVARTSDYNSQELSDICSASAIRAAILRGEIDAALCGMPENCRDAFYRALSGDASVEACALTDSGFLSSLYIYSLRHLTPEQLTAYAGVSEGLENLLLRAARESSNAEELLTACKSRRYTLARLRRLLPQITLGITRDMQCRHPAPTYARVLGCRSSMLHLMGEIQRSGALPVTPGGRGLSGDALWELEVRASDLWGLAVCNPAWRRAGIDYTHKFVTTC